MITMKFHDRNTYTQEEIFGRAKWVAAGEYTADTSSGASSEKTPEFPILRRTFSAGKAVKATFRGLGLGFFHCYINGTEITDRHFLPLSTDYEERENYPCGETLTGHRTYVPEFDVTDFLKEGKNTLAIHFGGGWYTFAEGKYGDPKVIYRLSVVTETGCEEFFSSEEDLIGGSFIKSYYFTRFEEQDYTKYNDSAFSCGFDDSEWKHAVPAQPLDTVYQYSDCPADCVAERLPVVMISEKEGIKTYDCGKNQSGIPVLRLHAEYGERVNVIFSECRNENGTIEEGHVHRQSFTVISDGTERIVMPRFTWFGFRYFSVAGNADPIEVRFIHADIPVSSGFSSDNVTLNWLYQTYLNTQFSNMHAGIPSDCPHIERRGYTGDGQLTCHAAMTMLDAKEFYRKWIRDISDCQDILSGHVQYTAPYTRCGGGPGGWGCAVVEVPYQYYRHYGDLSPVKEMFPQMLSYFEYLEAHSAEKLVVSDKAGEWCLGDWCPPMQVVLPAPFVNNYYYIRSMQRAIELARLIGREEDIPMLENRIEERRKATKDAYFNTWDGNYLGCLQGANAFAVDMGIGDDRTYRNLVWYYSTLGHLDTGICGTEIVVRVLFEHGDGALAAKLLMSDDTHSFEEMRRRDSTTLWEYWPEGTEDRSRNHPMFGAVTAFLFDYILGIGQKTGKAGYTDLVITPSIPETIGKISGFRTLPAGKLSAAYERQDDGIHAEITVPAGIRAIFRKNGMEIVLSEGKNTILFTD